MVSISIFDYQNYQTYLRSVLSTKGGDRGMRSRLAQVLRCQPSFIYRVLAEKVHLSLEHAIETSRFLQHAEEEERYFMLLIEKGKAGSKNLEQYFEKQLETIRTQRMSIKERIRIENDLSLENQVIYYSSWYVLATHILLSIPGFDTREKIAAHFKLPVSQIVVALDFLTRSGLAREDGGKFYIQNTRTHLAKGSPLLPRHHTNWRIRAIQAIDHERENDLHYSGAFTLSKNDFVKIRGTLLSFIEDSEPQIRQSKEETLCCINLDLFEV